MRRNIHAIAAFLPAEPGLRAHLFRVATLAARAAEHQGLEDRHIETVEWAALLHHVAIPRGVSGAPQLLKDLGLPPEPSLNAVPENVARVLNGSLDGAFEIQASGLVESANLFDEHIENLPYEHLPTEESVRELLASGMISKPFTAALESFRAVTRAELSSTIRKMPVFPRAALDALKLARDPNAGIREIEQAVARDAVLSGETIQMANSGQFGKSHPVGTLTQALSRIGTIAAGHLIATAALQRCFASPNLKQLWQHSFEATDTIVAMAASAKGVDASSAFLGGLVHDVGRLVYALSPATAAIAQWRDWGFPATYAELLVSGTDHAEIGSEVLAYWRFPDELVEAVRFHHRPELTPSRLAAAIYSAEDIDEALPSIARDHAAVKRLEITEIPRSGSAG